MKKLEIIESIFGVYYLKEYPFKKVEKEINSIDELIAALKKYDEEGRKYLITARFSSDDNFKLFKTAVEEKYKKMKIKK